MVFEMRHSSNNKIQLFISFRGHDERLKLLSHLKHHLKQNKVNVFIDDGNVGEPLTNLYKHIRNSRIVIVIFSINYLESCWCLNELVHIRKCLMTEKIDFVIPIFYNVDPSHVKDQSGEFGKKFLALHEKHPESIKRWTKALKFVSNYGGLAYDKNDSISELDFVKAVVDTVDIVLTKITFKDWHYNHCNNSLTLTKRSEGSAANLAKFNMYVDDIMMNMLYYYSEQLAALDLERQRRSLQNYNRGVYFKEQSRIQFDPYFQELSWTLDGNIDATTHFEHRRNNSDPNIYQIFPPRSDERTMVQYHPDAYEVIIDDVRENETIVVHDHSVMNHVSNSNFQQEDTVEVQKHPVINQVSNKTIQQTETTLVENQPVINQVRNNNIQQTERTLVQNQLVINQVSNENIEQDAVTEIQSRDVTQVDINNNLLQKCYEKCNEDTNCVVFMWYCLKLWFNHK